MTIRTLGKISFSTAHDRVSRSIPMIFRQVGDTRATSSASPKAFLLTLRANLLSKSDKYPLVNLRHRLIRINYPKSSTSSVRHIRQTGAVPNSLLKTWIIYQIRVTNQMRHSLIACILLRIRHGRLSSKPLKRFATSMLYQEPLFCVIWSRSGQLIPLISLTGRSSIWYLKPQLCTPLTL